MKRARPLVALLALIALAVGRRVGRRPSVAPATLSPRPSIVRIIIDALHADKLIRCELLRALGFVQ